RQPLLIPLLPLPPTLLPYTTLFRSIAIFIYLGLVSGALGLPHPGGVESYLLIALSVILLFGLKIAALRLLGFVFDIAQVLRRYRSEEHTSELQSRENLVWRLLLEKK